MLLVCTNPSAKPARQAGFSLVELMVAMLLSLILLGGVLAIFASSRKTYETTDQLSRIQENGRFALDVIVRDLRGAGFTGCSKRSAFSSALRTPTSLLWNFERAIEGFDGQGSGWLPNTLDTTVVTSANSAGDVLAIRLPRGEFEPQRLTTFMSGQSSPVQIANVTPALINAGDVVQVADCQSRAVFQVTGNAAGALAHADVAAAAGPPATPGNISTDLGAAFTEQSEVVALRSVVYFLRAGSTAGAGTSLWRRVSGATAAEEVVEGVESLQFQYGEDTDGDNVIAVDEYRTANLVTDWNQVLSVRVALLVRSLSEYGNDTDARAYQVLERNIPAPNDRRLRQIFTTTVTLRNAAT